MCEKQLCGKRLWMSVDGCCGGGLQGRLCGSWCTWNGSAREVTAMGAVVWGDTMHETCV